MNKQQRQVYRQRKAEQEKIDRQAKEKKNLRKAAKMAKLVIVTGSVTSPVICPT